MTNSFRFRNPSARGYSVITANNAASTVTFTLPAVTGEISISDSADGQTLIASGNTAQRPTGLTTEAIRFNTDLGVMEYYSSVYAGWFNVGNSPTVNISYLVVAGGGASGGLSSFQSGLVGGGGGAGGLLANSTPITVGTVYTITVGAGGSGTDGDGTNGSTSSFNSFSPLDLGLSNSTN
jgi:hypothetical protein